MSDFPFICDSGTGYLKIGYSNKTFPELQIPAVIGRPIIRSGEKAGSLKLKVFLIIKEIMIGDEVEPVR